MSLSINKKGEVVITLDNCLENQDPGLEIYLRRQGLYDLLAERNIKEFGNDGEPVYYAIQLLKDMDFTPNQINKLLKDGSPIS